MREVSNRINFIVDGNSIPSLSYYGTNLTSKFETYYGAGNYEYTNIAVGGQTIDNGTANCMQGRIDFFLNNAIKGFSRNNIIIFQELRNEMYVNGSTPAQAALKLQTYVDTIRAIIPSHVNYKIGFISAIADNETGVNIPTANSIIMSDNTGRFDFKIDLYNHSTFDDFTSSLFLADETHPSTTGKEVAAEFIVSSLFSLYP